MSAIDTYLATVPEPHKTELERIRQIVLQIVPDAQETISYGMPAFKYRGQPLLYFSSFKHHMSLFPTAEPIAKLGDALVGFKTSKGTLQFTADHPVPEPLIKALLEIRLQTIDRT